MTYKIRLKKRKYESCVKQLKEKPNINPYAVCRTSIYGKKIK